MKKTTLILITIFLFLQSCKSQENLYVLFENNSEYMKKVRMGRDKPYNYNFEFHKNIELNLTSNLDSQTGPVKIDTFQMDYLKKIKLRDYNWLKKFVSKYRHPAEIHFSEIYKDLYVVEIDPISKKVIISKVQSVTYED
mgnify:CR=1 FL=1